MSSPLSDRTRTKVNPPTPPTRRPRTKGRHATPRLVVAGLAVAAITALAMPEAARASDLHAADIAVVAALQGATVPLPARKPDLTPDTEQAGDVIDVSAAEPETVEMAALVPQAGRPDNTPPVSVAARIDRGDTLIGLLIEAGVDRIEAHKAVKALDGVFDPRHMRPGHVVNIHFDEPDDDTLTFKGFDFEPTAGTCVLVQADPDAETGYGAEEKQAPLSREVVRFGGPITLSLYQAAIDAGVSDQALAEMIRILSYDIDFQRDIQKDDTFEVMYERFVTEDGRHVRDGKVMFTALTNGGERITAYAFETEDGREDYFNEAGQGIRKPLMRTPIDGARLSSSFGMRRHPILGYSRMHTGVDFAAPTGTPIYAAGDGVVNFAGRKGGYGNYIRIRHNGEFATAYAHLSRIQVRNGQRVEQGDVIGRVGTTGMSTGPHLHYEIIRNGEKVNPMGVRFQPAIELAGAELQRFQAERRAIDSLYASLRGPTEIASTGGGE